jgi:hypothetical protein
MPLIYNGQEAGNRKRLAFFEKDPIDWRPHPLGKLYQNHLMLMKKNTALWHGQWGARMIKVPNSSEAEVLSFVRMNEEDKVFAIFNFSDQKREVNFYEDLYPGDYIDYTSGQSIMLKENLKLRLAPWEYRVFVKTPDSDK